MGVLIRWGVAALLTAAAVWCGPTEVQAQSAPSHDLTAAFLANFVRFTTWPAEVLPAGAPITVCISGDDLVADSLGQITRGQKIDGRSITVRRRDLKPPFEGCHVIYGASLDEPGAQDLIRETSGRPMLTVTDSVDFAAQGGIANFFMDGTRMRFAVNPEAARQAQLRISSRLLSLAKVVP